jgi:peroxiredoxin
LPQAEKILSASTNINLSKFNGFTKVHLCREAHPKQGQGNALHFNREMRARERPMYLKSLLTFFICLSLITPALAQPQIGEKAAGFITSTLDGKRIALKDYWEKQGKTVMVLSFFATWCQPCKEDLKYLQKVQDQYGEKGLQVVAVLTQDSSKEAAVNEFMSKLGVNLPVLTDEYGIIGKRYAITYLPTNFMIGKDGVLKGRYFGYSEDVKRHFEEQLKNLLLNPS